MSRYGLLWRIERNVRNIPDIDPTAYGEDALRALDLLRLSDAFEATQSLLDQVEAGADEVRKRIGPIPADARTPDQVAEHGGAARRLALARRVARDVRRRFVDELAAKCERRGFLGRTAVFQVSKDLMGVQRIPLDNPPSPPAKPTAIPRPEGGFR